MKLKDEAIYAQAVQPQITCWTGGPEAQQVIHLLGCSLQNFTIFWIVSPVFWSTTYYELKLNSLQLQILYFQDPASHREWCDKATWKKSHYKM